MNAPAVTSSETHTHTEYDSIAEIVDLSRLVRFLVVFTVICIFPIV